MKICHFLFGLALAQSTSPANETTTSTATPSTTKSTTTISTTSTTTKSTTTSTTTTTTTPEETTKSESTTASPETTPQPTPAPTPAPTPTNDGIIRITDGNLTCVMLSFEGDFFHQNSTMSIQSNQSTVIDNNCEQPIIQSGDIQIGFTFNYTTIADGNRNTTVWDIQSIQITQDTDLYTADKLEGMQAHAGSSYSCITGFNTTLTGDNNQTTTLSLTEVKIQYGITDISPIVDDKIFTKAESCAADMEQSLLVPIVVACALAGLVLAICVAYIIGRRKTYSGYSAM
jgi:hypothetical protein